MTEAVAEHRAALVRFVAARIDDRAAAEDIVHDVLLRAWERREQLRDTTRLAAWLYQMTRNAIVDHHRARRPSEELPEELAAPPDGDRSAAQELAQCLTPFVERLPEHYRAAIELSELQGLTQQQTADRLGISLSGAKSRVQRARAKLQEMLLDCCRIELDCRNAVRDFERRC